MRDYTEITSFNTGPKGLGRLYRRLSDSMEVVRWRLSNEKNVNDYLCLVVLEDDLRCLLAECKEFLSTSKLSKISIDSFEARCITVLDEIAFLCDDTSELYVVQSSSNENIYAT